MLPNWRSTTRSGLWKAVRNACLTSSHFSRSIIQLQQKTDHENVVRQLIELRGAWRDRDTNDVFAHCSLTFYFLDFKFSNFVCPSELHPLIWFFLKNSFRKKNNIRKITQNALAPSIFIVVSIVLKVGTPLLRTQAKIRCYRFFNFALEVEIWTKNLQKHCFTLPGRL